MKVGKLGPKWLLCARFCAGYSVQGTASVGFRASAKERWFCQLSVRHLEKGRYCMRGNKKETITSSDGHGDRGLHWGRRKKEDDGYKNELIPLKHPVNPLSYDS